MGKTTQSVATASKISQSEVTESAYLDHSHFRSILTPEANVVTSVYQKSAGRGRYRNL